MKGRNFRKQLLSMITLCFFLCMGETVMAGMPTDAVSYNGHFYKLFNAAQTWRQAKADCERMGGHLVTITSKGENDFIKRLIFSKAAANKYHFWAGGTDKKNEGTWEWVTGEKWGFTYWEDGQPNNSSSDSNDPSGQDYLEIWYVPEYAGDRIEWNDEPNSGLSEFSPEEPWYLSLPYYGYICEWDTKTSIKNASIQLDSRSYSYNGGDIEPGVDVLLGDKWLVLGKDYTVKYKNNKNPGTATVTVTGKGNYSGSIKTTFKIYYDLNDAYIKFKNGDTYVYKGGILGKTYTPKFTVKVKKINGSFKTIGKKDGYKITWKNNDKTGTAHLIIEGFGKCSGSIVEPFWIVPKAPTAVEAKAEKGGKVVLKWRKVICGGKNVTIEYPDYYLVRYGTSKKIGQATQIEVKKMNSEEEIEASYFTNDMCVKYLTGLSKNKKYYFWVAAVKNGQQGDWSGRISVKTKKK